MVGSVRVRPWRAAQADLARPSRGSRAPLVSDRWVSVWRCRGWERIWERVLLASALGRSGQLARARPWPGPGRIPAGRRFRKTFLGVKGSPVQIRPSRLVRASFRTQEQDREWLLGAQRAPQQTDQTAVAAACGRHNAAGQGPAEPTQGVVQPSGALVSGAKKTPLQHPAVKADSGQHQPGPRRDQGGRPAPSSPLPCYLKRTVFRRSLPLLAGPARP